MKAIKAQLASGDKGAEVANLQDALALLLKKKQVTVAARQRVSALESLDQERRIRTYKDTTKRFVAEFQKKNSLPSTGAVDEPTAAALNKALEGLGEIQKPEDKLTYVVKGVVRHVQGTPAPSLVVKAFGKRLRTEDPLGKAPTGKDGAYEIPYGQVQPLRAPRPTLDLLVRVFDNAGSEVADAVVRFDAAVDETVDLVVREDISRGPSEYEQLLTALEPHLGGVAISALTDDDITYLSGAIGARITFLVAAHRLAETLVSENTRLDAEVLYGLFRQGLPTDADALLVQTRDLQRQALVRAATNNTIRPSFADQSDKVVGQLRTLAVKRALESPTDGHTTLAQLLATRFEEPVIEKFLTVQMGHVGTPKEFWKKLEEYPDLKGLILRLRSTLQLGELTARHLPLVGLLQQASDAKKLKVGRRTLRFEALEDLAQLSVDDWRSLVAGARGRGGAGFPPDTDGRNDGEKTQNYARVLADRVEDAFPTRFFACRLAESTLEGKEDLLTFLANNPKFDLRSTRLRLYLQQNAASDPLRDVKNREEAQKRLGALMRAWKLAPRYAYATALVNGGIDSAHRVTRIGKNVFQRRFGEALGGDAAASRVHERAKQVRATALHLFMEYGDTARRVEMRAVPDAAVLDPKPQPNPGPQPRWHPTSTGGGTDEEVEEPDAVAAWSAIFGPLQMCECAHGQSVYGPAAYFADLLLFLSDRPSRLEEVSAKDILFQRRPDLGEIELTCDNATSPLPYVDLVNEVLENAVAPPDGFTPFDLQDSLADDLNSGQVTDPLRDSFTPPLSADAVITVGAAGKATPPLSPWWTIDEPAFTYLIRKESSTSPPRVVARSLQTKASADERAANPQYVNFHAYDQLRSNAVYPWSLPFDLWNEEASAYLAHLGVPRYQVMEALLPGTRAKILEKSSVALDYLHLGGAEADIITGKTTTLQSAESPGPWNLWGFDTEELDPEHSIPDPADSTRRIADGKWIDVLAGRVDVFIQQSGLTYKEMLQLLGTYFVNPKKDGQRATTIQAQGGAPLETCETDKLSLVGLDADGAARIVRFVRLWRRLGWSMRDLDRAVTAFDMTDLSDHSLVRLSHVERLHRDLGVPVERLLSWWAPIDTALYVDHDAPRQPRAASLYERLFRNRAVISPPDSAFDDDPTGLRGTLRDHVGAISAAFGISARDFELLLAERAVVKADKLNLDQLSRMHRHASLAKALRLPVRDYISALHLIDKDPFKTTTKTLRFVEAVGKIRDAGITFAELDYLLRHQTRPESPIAPTDEAVATFLAELRTGLQTIAAENTFRDDLEDAVTATSDPNGDLTRQKLALLGWDAATIDVAIATLNGSVVYQEPLAALPAGLVLPNAPGVYAVDLASLPNGFEFPPILGGVMSYDNRDKQLKTTRALAKRERDLLKSAAQTNGDRDLVSAVDSLFETQDNLRGDISYDADNKLLRFAGPMTKARKESLSRTAGADDAFRTAVAHLHDAPRTCVRRQFRGFAIPTFCAGLDSMPQGIAFPPPTLKDKAYLDDSVHPLRLRFKGVMTAAERDTLLSLSDDTAYTKAIGKLYAAADVPNPASADVFLGSGDTDALFERPIEPDERFKLVLERLLPHLKHALSASLVTERVAGTLQLEPRTAEALLNMWLSSPSDHADRCIADLLAPAFSESHTSVKPSREAFPAQFKTFVLLHKVALLVARLKLTHRQLGWVFGFADDAEWLSPDELPIEAQEDASGFEGFLRLVESAILQDALPQGEGALAELLACAHSDDAKSNNAAKRNAAKESWFDALTKWAQWPRPDLEELLGAAGDSDDKGQLRVDFPSGYFGAFLLTRLSESFAVLKRLGVSAQRCTDLVHRDVSQKAARTVRQAVRAKYDEEQWLNLAKPLCDVLRARRRAALTDYLVSSLPLPVLRWPHPELASPGSADPAVRELQQKLNACGIEPPVKVTGLYDADTIAAVNTLKQRHGLAEDGKVDDQTWDVLDKARRRLRDSDDLYAHFLIDVEMEPCMMTSRLKQAACSVQLFVQRCFMNLEPEVLASIERDDHWHEWQWMKNYRVWEANRKIFMYPENWIEPELRDDKSPFFRELEGELLQSNLTLESAATALTHYLEKLDQVARLEVVGMYRQREDDSEGNTTVDILHVFGRTPGTPHIYFYRQWVDGSSWTAWERVDLDIEGDHLVPVVWNRRLFLFWPIFSEQADQLELKMSDGALSGTTPTRHWQVKLAWSERKAGAWTTKRVSRESPGLYWDKAVGRESFRFRTLVDDGDNLVVGHVHPGPLLPPAWQLGTAYPWSSLGSGHGGGSSDSEHEGLGAIWRGGGSSDSEHGDLWTGGCWSSGGSGHGGLSSYGVVAVEVGELQRRDRQVFQLSPWEWVPTIEKGAFLLVVPESGVARCSLIKPDSPEEGDWDQGFASRFDENRRYLRGVAANYMHFEQADPSGSQLYLPRREMVQGIEPRTQAEPALCKAPPWAFRLLPPSDGTPIWDHPFFLEDEQSAFFVSAVLCKNPSPSLAWLVLYKIESFYHPFARAFVSELNRKGLDGLLRREMQLMPWEWLGSSELPSPVAAFDLLYGPAALVDKPYPVEKVDFESDGAYAIYNWELFFHAPLLVADRLMKNQRHEEAQKWFHYIFDPTDSSSFETPQRYWHTKPFFQRTREGYQRERLEYILRLLAKGADPEVEWDPEKPYEPDDWKQFDDAVKAWRADPFKPHLVARQRETAYQKAVVMKYIENLVAWGDQLFRRETIESINEATQLYVLAAEILGRRPEEVPARAYPRVHTYNTLEQDHLDPLATALVEVEEYVSPSASDSVTTEEAPSLPTMLYFCLPKNDKLLGYWDTVADRLFKIRHCMTIEGVERQLPLYEPPIEPGLLVKAAAAGVDIGTALSDVSPALPHYRFNVLSQKATELCGELKVLGGAVLSALEKRDAEQLSLLRAQHETTLLGLVEEVRKQQIDEAEKNLEALRGSREVAVSRYQHYQKLLGVQSPKVPGEGERLPEARSSQHVTIEDQGGFKEIQLEKQEMEQLKEADEKQRRANEYDAAASIAHIVPNFNIEPWGLGATFGGSNVGSMLSAVAGAYRAQAGKHSYKASKAGRLGQFALRAHDWKLQNDLAAGEIMQIDKQIIAADLRKQIAERELSNHRQQLEDAQEVEEYLRDKFSNQELYGWMLGQLAGIYFKTYQLAYDLAKRAERAFRYELGLPDSSFIQFGYWDSLKKGLLAGERLSHDLKRMEVSYLDQNKREHEVTKHVSLAQVDPMALVQLRQTGSCEVSLPEALFDLDHAGHYMRRIKSVSLTIPCVTGPYTGVSCALTLLRSSVRQAGTPLGGKYGRQPDGDQRFADLFGAVQSVVTSSGQADSGLFETNLRDERFLPFEGAGVISDWRIQLPVPFRQFDYDTISDVILHLRYTAREGGALLGQRATAELQDAVNSMVQSAGEEGLARAFSLRHEFPTEWHRFLHRSDPTGDQQATLDLSEARFPFMFQGKGIRITKFALLAKAKEDAAASDDMSKLKMSLNATGINNSEPWEGLLRFELTGDFKPGTWTLAAWLERNGNGSGHVRFDPGALEDIQVVCFYSLGQP
jgi:peptidoglycan hydrolase-like protein with peptidoglycan-binding domain